MANVLRYAFGAVMGVLVTVAVFADRIV